MSIFFWVHKPRQSLLKWNRTEVNYWGFSTWACLLLLISAVKLTLDNYLKYGYHEPFTGYFSGISDYFNNSIYAWLTILTCMGAEAIFCLAVENLLAYKLLSETKGLILHISNFLVILMVPIVVTHTTNRYTIYGIFISTQHSLVLVLKLWSYIHVNQWCRLHPDLIVAKDKDKPPPKYPANLTLGNLLYFCAAPTLCYEPNFPRTNNWRISKMLLWILETIAIQMVTMTVGINFLVPAVRSSLINYHNFNIIPLTINILEISISNHLLWLLYFYGYFHVWLNLLGETLYFADRNYYNDWWNAGNLDAFWRDWNMPVHKWVLRHMYLPLINLGYSKESCKKIVFVFSGILHEYLVSVTLKTYRVYAFVAMVAQIPLSDLSLYLEKNIGRRWGNAVVWIPLITGQAVGIVLYYHDYVITHHGEAGLADFGQI